MGQMHYSVQALLSAQFGPEFHAQVVALSKCPQMISQHVRTMVHTGMDAGSVFLKAVPFSTRKMSWASFVAFEKKIIPSPPPHISGFTMGPKYCLCPLKNRSGTPLPYFGGAGCEKRDCRDTRIVTHTICNIRMHQNLPFSHEKTAQNGRFSVKN